MHVCVHHRSILKKKKDAHALRWMITHFLYV